MLDVRTYDPFVIASRDVSQLLGDTRHGAPRAYARAICGRGDVRRRVPVAPCVIDVRACMQRKVLDTLDTASDLLLTIS